MPTSEQFREASYKIIDRLLPSSRSFENLEGTILLDRGVDENPLVIVLLNNDEIQREGADQDHMLYILDRNAKRELYTNRELYLSDEKPQVDFMLLNLDSYDLIDLAGNIALIPKETIDVITDSEGVYPSHIGRRILKLLDPEYREAVLNVVDDLTIQSLIARIPELEAITDEDIDRWVGQEPDVHRTKSGYRKPLTQATIDVADSKSPHNDREYDQLATVIDRIFVSPQGHTSRAIYDALLGGELEGIEESDLVHLREMMSELPEYWQPYRDIDYIFRFIAISSQEIPREDFCSNLLSGEPSNIESNRMSLEGVRLVLLSILRRLEKGESLEDIERSFFGKG